MPNALRLLTIAALFPAAASAQSACDWKGDVSPATTQPVTLVVDNQTAYTTRLFWIDFDGNPVFYAEIAPRGQYQQGTYLGHLWVMENEAGDCDRVFAAEQDGVIRLTPADAREEGVGGEGSSVSN